MMMVRMMTTMRSRVTAILLPFYFGVKFMSYFGFRVPIVRRKGWRDGESEFKSKLSDYLE